MEPGHTPDASANGDALPTVDDVQHVEAERMDTRTAYRYGTRAPRYTDHQPPSGSAEMPAFMKPPVFATWLSLAIAWLFLGSKIPFTVFLGIPFSLVAVFLAAICLSRGGALTGSLVMLLGTVGSLVVYIVGLFRFLIRF